MQATEANSRGQVLPHAFTVEEFCETHRISRALFYILQRDGRGPRVMKCGRRTLIARESAEAWRRQMEQEEVRK